MRRGRRDDILRARRGMTPVAPEVRDQQVRETTQEALSEGREHVDDTIRWQGTEDRDVAPVPTRLQYVIVLQDDKTLKNFATLLHARNAERSTIYYWYDAPADVAPEMAGECDVEVVLDQTSIIYLVGHGDISYRRLAGLSGSALAARFKAQFAGFGVARISIIGCLTGSAVGEGDALTVADNFTQQFHRTLLPIRTTVTGRNRCILVTQGERGDVVEYDCDATSVGRLYDATNRTVDRAGDKLTYFWEGDEQQRRFGD